MRQSECEHQMCCVRTSLVGMTGKHLRHAELLRTSGPRIQDRNISVVHSRHRGSAVFFSFTQGTLIRLPSRNRELLSQSINSSIVNQVGAAALVNKLVKTMYGLVAAASHVTSNVILSFVSFGNSSTRRQEVHGSTRRAG